MVLTAKENFACPVDDAHLRKVTYGASINSRWEDMIAAGGMTIEDNGGNKIQDPEVSITDATRIVRNKTDFGLILLLALKYDKDFVVSTNPIINVFGVTPKEKSTADNQPWGILQNRAKAISVTITATATDTIFEGFRYSLVDLDDNLWDMLGSDQIVCGVQKAVAGAGGGGASTVSLVGRVVN